MQNKITDDAGELNRRVVFERFVGERDSVGDLRYLDDAQWADEVKVWASVRSIGAGEFYRAGQSESYVTHNIKIRYREDIRAEMRVRCGDRRYRIKSPPIDLGGGRQWLLLKVEELVP